MKLNRKQKEKVKNRFLGLEMARTSQLGRQIGLSEKPRVGLFEPICSNFKWHKEEGRGVHKWIEIGKMN